MQTNDFIILLMNSFVYRVGDLRYLWWRQKNAGYPGVSTELTKYKHIEWVQKLQIYWVEKPLKLHGWLIVVLQLLSNRKYHFIQKFYVAMMENMFLIYSSLSNRNNNFC